MDFKHIIIGTRKLKFFCTPIGKGSYAKVFRVIDTETNEEFALKRLDLNKIEEKMARRINIEIEIITNLEHENIVKCSEAIFSDKYIYLFMEYCEEGTLSDYIKKNELSEEEVHIFMTQIKNALHYLREKNIMHRDLKSSNILLKNGIIKLADFGFAKKMECNDTELAHTTCGTPLYMAPEIILDNKYNSKSDLWSVGVVFYEMIYGKYPYSSNNIVDLMKKIKTMKVDYDISMKEISQECIQLMNRLLTFNPAERIEWTDFINHVWFAKVFIKDNQSSLIGKIFREKEKNLLFKSIYDESCITYAGKQKILTESINIPYKGDNELKGHSISLGHLVKDNYFPQFIDKNNNEECVDYLNENRTASFTDILIDYLSNSYNYVKKKII